MSTELNRAYLPRGSVAHILPAWASLNSTERALCGIHPPAFTGGWHGSGSWDESERLKSLAICLHCERVIRRPESEVRLVPYMDDLFDTDEELF